MTDPNIYIGDQYGIYTIDSVLSEKDKWNHYQYKGVCKECGFERFGSIYDFKNKLVEICKHISLLTTEQFNIWYEKNKKQCLYCGNDIPFEQDERPSDYKEKQFCDQSCAASYNNKNRAIKKTSNKIIQSKEKSKNYCKNCGKEIKSNNQFCSNECHNEFKYNVYIDNWKNGLISGAKGYGVSLTIRKYLFKKYNNKCSQCGWGEVNPTTGKIPLEVHHKDGDYTNNKEDNLDLLCPNCHSLTPTYKGINKGNGRKDRKKYYLN